MNSRLLLFSLLLICGCAASRPNPNADDLLKWIEREKASQQVQVGHLDQTSRLLIALRQIDAAFDATSSNIASAQTVGHKRIMPSFEYDGGLIYRRSFDQGDLYQTNERLDLAIVGDGFFEIQMPDGTHAYTRDGTFRVNSSGVVTTSRGCPITSGWSPISSHVTSILISPKGVVTCISQSGLTTFQIYLVRFPSPEKLSLNHDGLFIPTEASGIGSKNNPAQDGTGSVMQGYLEMSNVHLVEEVARIHALKSWKRSILKVLDIPTDDR